MTSTPSPELIVDGKTSSNNIEGTHKRVEYQVAKELGKLTNEIWKNFYSINENWEVEYDIDLVKKYLETKKDKPYSELLKSQNTAAWIMAVQIALSSIGYDVGKVDWILKNKWAKTSKTVEQIIKFQSDNGLKVDWQPGSETIKELLKKLWSTTSQDLSEKEESKEEDKEESKEESKEKSKEERKEESKDQSNEWKETITKAEFDLLCFRTSLTDEEMKKVVDYANEKWWSWLSLRIRKIEKNQLKELSKIKSGLRLNEVQTITNEQLKSLSNVEWLSLWLKEIKLEQAKIITSWNVKKLELESLDWWLQPDWSIKWSMTDKVARELSKIHELHINPARLTDNQKEILKNRK